MTWSIEVYCREPLRSEHIKKKVGPYASQNLARWWAVNFAQSGSISINQGQADEELIPIAHVVRMRIKED